MVASPDEGITKISSVSPALPPHLMKTLDELRSRNFEEFFRHLEERKKKEREWANLVRNPETTTIPLSNAKWYCANQLSADYRNQWFAKHVPGNVVLDYACGDGTQVLECARMGAALAVGIDVSDYSIHCAAQAAAHEGLSDRCVFIVGDCEDTGLPDDSFDVILCGGMLHHLDLAKAYPEMHRILKPGGCVYAQEALNYNPIIRLYRRLTPALRTGWEKEHILSLKDVRAAKQYFTLGEIRYWHLTSILSVFTRKAPTLFRTALRVLNGVDRCLLVVPGIQMLAWQFTFELFKPALPLRKSAA